MLVQNLVVRRQTLNTPHEVIESVYRNGKHKFYKLGCQTRNLIFDLCAEPYGFNRMEKESVKDYIKRMIECSRLYNRTDYSVHEFIPKVMKDINALL